MTGALNATLRSDAADALEHVRRWRGPAERLAPIGAAVRVLDGALRRGDEREARLAIAQIAELDHLRMDRIEIEVDDEADLASGDPELVEIVNELIPFLFPDPKERRGDDGTSRRAG